MPAGPGKYDDVATIVQDKTQARGVIVIVFAGNKGSGFSVQLTPDMLLAVPSVLRAVADEIEQSSTPTRQ